MSLSFPSSPAPGDSFTTQGITFVWTGTVWAVPPSGLQFATEVEARGGVVADRAMTPLRGAQAIDEFDVPPGSVTPPEAVCVAMCSFNGGNGQIFFEKNILSVGGAGSGLYTLTFRDELPDVNYVVFGSALGITNHPVMGISQVRDSSTQQAVVVMVGTTGANLITFGGFLVASALIHVGVFR